MKNSFKKGYSFGLTSGIITTIGLMVGLYSSTHSKLVVLGGILTIAIADAFSDALGIHMAEESQKQNTTKQIWESTFATFISKLVFAMIFIIPVLLFELSTAIIISIIFGLFLLSALSYFMAKNKKTNPTKVIIEHLVVAIIVILATYYLGNLITYFFS